MLKDAATPCRAERAADRQTWFSAAGQNSWQVLCLYQKHEETKSNNWWHKIWLLVFMHRRHLKNLTQRVELQRFCPRPNRTSSVPNYSQWSAPTRHSSASLVGYITLSRFYFPKARHQATASSSRSFIYTAARCECRAKPSHPNRSIINHRTERTTNERERREKFSTQNINAELILYPQRRWDDLGWTQRWSCGEKPDGRNKLMLKRQVSVP